jgi:hypothetical protein
MNPRKSLLLVGLPRGFTSFTYDVVARATGLQRAPASEGEVLNPDGASGAAALSGRPFHYRLERGDHSEVYPAARAILDRFRNGYVIKDVVQPWLVLDYLKEHPDAYRVLYIRRDLNRVRFHLAGRGWTFVEDVEAVDRAFSHFPTLDVQEALFDSDAITRAITRLGYRARRVPYMTRSFCRRRDGRAAKFFLGSHDRWPDPNAPSLLAREEYTRDFFAHVSLLGLLEHKPWAADAVRRTVWDFRQDRHALLEYRAPEYDVPALLIRRMAEDPWNPAPHHWLACWHWNRREPIAAVRELRLAHALSRASAPYDGRAMRGG